MPSFKDCRKPQTPVTPPQTSLSQEVALRLNPHDKSEYCALILSNGLKVTLVSNMQASTAAASLRVAVGSHNNPAEWHGLAHFLEHMLFMGCKKYAPFGDSTDTPAGEYQSYLKLHGGSHNAATDDRDTNFHFSVLPDGLPGALKRLARFFITPAFDPKFVRQELKAVDSEHHANQTEENFREWSVIQQLANPLHPIRQFSTGDIKSLNQAGKSTSLREAVMQFYYDYYSPQRMTLAVVAPLPIAELRQIVEQFFTHIPDHPVKPNQITTIAYTPNETGREVRIQRLDQTYKIELMFAVPQYLMESTAACTYLSAIMLDQGNGSLYKLLADKNWIESLHIITDDVSHTQSSIRIIIFTTEIAKPHIEQMLDYVFAYIKFLQQTEPSMDLFTDIQQYDERDMSSRENPEPLEYVNSLSEDMHKHPLQDVLFADTVTKETILDPEAVRAILAHLNPQNMLLIISSPDINGELIEPYYGVKYSTAIFTSQQLERWQSQAGDLFTMPGINQFMPKNLEMLPKPANIASDSVPQQIVNNNQSIFWHKQDQTFNVPKVEISMLIYCKDLAFTPKRVLLHHLFGKIFNDSYSQYSSKCLMAGIDCYVTFSFEGIQIDISMFSDRVNLVITTMLELIKTCTTSSARFAAHKDSIKRELISFYQENPYLQAITLCNNILNKYSWPNEMVLSEIDAITEEDFSQYLSELLSEVQVKGLILGNINKETAIDLGNLVIQKLNCQPSMNKQSTKAVLQINNGGNWFYNFASSHADSTVVSYYQAQTNGVKTEGLSRLLANILAPAFYTQLRSHEQLGYIVDLQHTKMNHTNTIVLLIESANHDPNYIQRRIRNFCLRFQDKLAKIPRAELENYIQALIADITSRPGSLGEEATKYWSVINNGDNDFAATNKLAEAITTITPGELQEFFNNLFINPQTMRCLTVRTTPKVLPKSRCLPYQATSQLMNAREILDIEEFKQVASFDSNDNDVRRAPRLF